MITEKQKLIAEQMLYGLQFFHEENDRVGKYAFGKRLLHWRDIINSKEKLILRPLSDLTKEITHKGYNNGEPFVPLIEIAKKVEPKLSWYLKTDNTGTYAYARENAYPHYVRPQQLECCSIDIYDFLNLLHFDTRNLIESNEAISTDVINPYGVK